MVGGLYIDPAIVGRVFDGNKGNKKLTAKKGVAPALTEREADVLKMAALGFTNKEIASRRDGGVKSVVRKPTRRADWRRLASKHAPNWCVTRPAKAGWISDRQQVASIVTSRLRCQAISDNTRPYFIGANT